MRRLIHFAPVLTLVAGLSVLARMDRAHAVDLSGDLPAAWAVAEARAEEAVAWMNTTYGTPLMYSRYPSLGNTGTGKWMIITNTRDWRDGFWPGILWMLAQHTGEDVWRQRATSWSEGLAATTNIDHDIGFITLCSLGKGHLFHDGLTDFGGAYRGFTEDAILAAAGKLDSRFNKPNPMGMPVPTGFTRSWNSPFEDPHPVCIDNLMNLEVLFEAYEMNGRQPGQRVWFEHALAHARSSIAKHMRADGSTYHVVKHFDSGPQIGQVERKSTVQGYGDETTWSRGQAWAIYGFTTVYRYASRDPGTDASDILAAARATADYFMDHLPDAFEADAFNHRAGDFVPPSDFDAALGEPTGPWNDANNNYSSAAGTGLGDRKPALGAFTLRDTSAAAIAASGLIELSGYMTVPEDRDRYLGAAEDILKCLITYDGPDLGTDPDYLCNPGEAANPGILRAGSNRWGDPNQSLIFGDYYFLEALARYEALKARELLAATWRATHVAGPVELSFERSNPAPTLKFYLERSPNLAAGSWSTIATKTGVSSWTGPAVLTAETLPGGRSRERVGDPTPSDRGFFRISTRSIGGGR